MATKREKGNEFQRWIKDWLEERGWAVYNQAPCGKMIKIKGRKIFISQRNDIFGCDIIARRDRKKESNSNFSMATLWIQATLDSNVSRKVEELKKYPWGSSLESRPQIWMKNNKGEVNIKELVIYYDQFTKANVYETIDIGKIIRRKFYKCERINFEF